MADGHAHRLAVTGDAKLAATAGGVAGGHGLVLSVSVATRSIEWWKTAHVYENGAFEGENSASSLNAGHQIRHGFVTAGLSPHPQDMNKAAGDAQSGAEAIPEPCCSGRVFLLGILGIRF
jgi:hypothetical protein